MEKFNQKKLLFTGGSGRLGSEMKKLLPKALYPTSMVFNITEFGQMEKYIKSKKPKIIIHAAAFTSPPLIEKQPEKGIGINIIGTANLAILCIKYNIKLVYICTDYVFNGEKGNYLEEDQVLPVNRYAWSKLGGECSVRMLPEGQFLTIRTSFGEKIFPYEKAFVDHFTSRESVDIIAKKIVKAIKDKVVGVLHIGYIRRSVFSYAKSLGGRKIIGKISIKDVNFVVPKDTSLNTDRYRKLCEK